MLITKYAKFLESIQTKDMWDIIPESVKELHSLFKSKGKKLYLVGGSVRDFLTGDKPKDFDLATDATPDEVLAIIGKKWRTTTQGDSFFVVVVYTEDQPKGMEIATFREDVYGDMLGISRNPVTKFSTIEKDVERRDLTWNALFYDLDKRSIIDLVGGIEDLKNGVTRFVGDPDMRIKEDPLRILRLLRFTSRYGFTIDDKTAESIEKNKDQLKIIVHERIWDEFYKAYGQIKNFKVYFDYVRKFGLWEYIFPGMKIFDRVPRCFGPNPLVLYLAMLFKDEKVEALQAGGRGLQERMVQGCFIPVEISRLVVFLIWFQQFTPDKVTEFYAKKNSYRISDEIIREWISMVGLAGKEFEAFVKYRPTTNSQELMSKGFKGAELGREIKRLETEKFKQMI
jgi:tRNA nucleotidyltransferase/poly(A) polymerase